MERSLRTLGDLADLEILGLNRNQFRGEIPSTLGKLQNLKVLTLHANASLTGALPQSLTNLTKLVGFDFSNTGLCAPVDAAFQAWLQGIEQVIGSNCSE